MLMLQLFCTIVSARFLGPPKPAGPVVMSADPVVESVPVRVRRLLPQDSSDPDFWCKHFFRNCTSDPFQKFLAIRDEGLKHVTLAFAASASVYRKEGGLKHGHILANPSSTRWCGAEDTHVETGHRKHRRFGGVTCLKKEPEGQTWELIEETRPVLFWAHGIVDTILNTSPFNPRFDKYYDSYPCRSASSPTADGGWVEHSFHNNDAFMRSYKSESLGLTVIAFRGTDSAKDWFEYNFDLIKKDLPDVAAEPGYIAGFGEYFSRLQRVFDLWVEEAENAGHDIVLTGHSLGGAASYVAAYHLYNSPAVLRNKTKLKAVITFGSPPVGSEEWNTNYKTAGGSLRDGGRTLCQKTFSFRNEYDMIPLLPIIGAKAPCSGYIPLNADDQVQNTGPLAKHDMFTGYQRGLDKFIRSEETRSTGINEILLGGSKPKCEWRNNRWWTSSSLRCEKHEDCANGPDSPNTCFKGECEWLLKNDRCGDKFAKYNCAPGLQCVEGSGRRVIPDTPEGKRGEFTKGYFCRDPMDSCPDKEYSCPKEEP